MPGFRMPWSLRTLARAIWDNGIIPEADRTVTLGGGSVTALAIRQTQFVLGSWNAGSGSIPNGQLDVGISALNSSSKTFIIPMFGYTNSASDGLPSSVLGASWTIVNSVTIRAKIGETTINANGGAPVYYFPACVVEFN